MPSRRWCCGVGCYQQWPTGLQSSWSRNLHICVGWSPISLCSTCMLPVLCCVAGVLLAERADRSTAVPLHPPVIRPSAACIQHRSRRQAPLPGSENSTAEHASGQGVLLGISLILQELMCFRPLYAVAGAVPAAARGGAERSAAACGSSSAAALLAGHGRRRQ